MSNNNYITVIVIIFVLSSQGCLGLSFANFLKSKNASTNGKLVARRKIVERFFVFSAGVLSGESTIKKSAQAAGETAFVTGKISLSSGSEISKHIETDKAALYVTCRPDRVDNVPAAILNRTRGKPPPILAARFENPTFPYNFDLTSKDLTIEGAADDEGIFWWNTEEKLIVSARWDSDGVAATRSPDDLVGRGIAQRKNPQQPLIVEFALGGRGSFGKFVTQKAQRLS